MRKMRSSFTVLVYGIGRNSSLPRGIEMKWFKKKTYDIYATCPNCYVKVTLKIPMGVKSSGYEAICPNCGSVLVVGKLKLKTG